jgi:hypothetical protein
MVLKRNLESDEMKFFQKSSSYRVVAAAGDFGDFDDQSCHRHLNDEFDNLCQ